MTRDKDLASSIQDISENVEGFIADSRKTLDDVKSRMEILETKASRPGKVGPGDVSEAREHEKRFEAWIRKPHDSNTKQMW